MGLSSKDTEDGEVRIDDVDRLVGLDDDDVTSLLPVSSITTGGGGLENVVSLVEFLFPPRSPWCSTSVNSNSNIATMNRNLFIWIPLI